MQVMPNMDPNVTFGVLTDVISCDSVTEYDMLAEGEAASICDTTQEAHYFNIKKNDKIDDCSCNTEDYDNDYKTEPVKPLVGYIVMGSSSIAATEV